MVQSTLSIIKDEILGRNLAFWEKKMKNLNFLEAVLWVSAIL